ncbi:hypothetical protein KKE54_04850 [bacterium]|nr:hypothetical protein [bacterium]
MTIKRTLLITSVGSLAGQNILDALNNRRGNLKIIGTNSLAEAANNFRCDKTYLVPSAAQTIGFSEALIDIIEKENPDVIVPGRDDDIVILSQLRQKMPQHREKFLVGPEHLARIMDDKVQSYVFAQKYALPFAPTVESGVSDGSENARRLVEAYGFPLIAKPSRGNGSRGIWVVTDQTRLDAIINEPGYAIQPFFGQPKELEFDTRFGLPFFWEVPENKLYAVQVSIGKDGQLGPSSGVVAKMVGGKAERVILSNDRDMMDIADRFFKAFAEEGWRGPINLQLKKDDRFGYQAIEINGRFVGGTSARCLLGYDQVGWLINEWTGEEVIARSLDSEGVTLVTKSLCDFGVKQKDINLLNEQKQWVRPTSDG